MCLNMKVFSLSVLNLFMILLPVEPCFSCSVFDSDPSPKDIKESIVCLVKDNPCTTNQNLTCLGTVHPYISTSITSEEDFISPYAVQDDLEKRLKNKNIPCWFAIPLISCAVYTSECENGSIFQPFQKMFNITRSPCSSVEDTLPDFLRFENGTLDRCWNSLQEEELNTRLNELKGYQYNFWVLLLLLRTFVFLLVLFIQVRTPSTLSGIITFVEFLWLYNQFFSAEKSLVCLSSESLHNFSFFTAILVLCHYIQMAIVVGYVILTYALIVLFKQTGIILKDVVKKKTVSFPVPIDNIPMVLTTAVVALTDNDVSSISAFCSGNSFIWTVFLIFLCLIFLIIFYSGAWVLFKVAKTVIEVIQVQRKKSVNLHAKKKICLAYFKIGILSVIAVSFILFIHVNHSVYIGTIDTRPKIYLVNSASSYSSIGEIQTCVLKSHLNLAIVFFGIPFGLVYITVAWTICLIENWSLYRTLGASSTDEKNKSSFKEKSVVASQSAVVGKLSSSNEIRSSEHFQSFAYQAVVSPSAPASAFQITCV